MLSGKWIKEPSHTCASVWRASLSLENSLKCFLGWFGCSECSRWQAQFLTKGTRGGYFLSIIKHSIFYVMYLITDPINVMDFQVHSLPLWVSVKTTIASKCDLKRLPMIFYFFMTTISCTYKERLLIPSPFCYIANVFQLTWSYSSAISLVSFAMLFVIHSQPLSSSKVCFVQYPLKHGILFNMNLWPATTTLMGVSLLVRSLGERREVGRAGR